MYLAKQVMATFRFVASCRIGGPTGNAPSKHLLLNNRPITTVSQHPLVLRSARLPTLKTKIRRRQGGVPSLYLQRSGASRSGRRELASSVRCAPAVIHQQQFHLFFLWVVSSFELAGREVQFLNISCLRLISDARQSIAIRHFGNRRTHSCGWLRVPNDVKHLLVCKAQRLHGASKPRQCGYPFVFSHVSLAFVGEIIPHTRHISIWLPRYPIHHWRPNACGHFLNQAHARESI